MRHEDDLHRVETVEEKIGRLTADVDRIRTDKLAWKRRAIRANALVTEVLKCQRLVAKGLITEAEALAALGNKAGAMLGEIGGELS